MAVRHRSGAGSSVDAPWRHAMWPVIRPDAVVLAYDRLPLDTLYVSFESPPAPGYYVPLADADEPYDGLFVKVTEDDTRVVGAMLEGYLVGAHSRWPTWLNVAAAPGILDEALDAFGLALKTPRVDREDAVAAFLAEIRAIWKSVVA